MSLLMLLVGCGLGGGGGDKDKDVEPESCGENVEVFTERVWEPVLGNQCIVCHTSDGQAASTAMVLDPNDMLASLRAATSVADRLLQKPTGQHSGGHGGGTLVEEGGEAYKALSFWADWSTGTCELPSDNCADESLARRLRRLSHDEYDNTLSDLFNIESTLGQALAADVSVEGFNNDAEALTVAPLLADQYRSAAESVVDALDLDALLPCDPAELGYAACATVFIDDFGLRAFRRPINATELERYFDLWSAIAVEDSFEQGIRWVIIAMLQSPHFLYRSELGELGESGQFVFTDWEVASALSYLLWGTMPDEALFAAAGAGELHTGDQIDAQIVRMAADDRILIRTADFVDVWFHLDLLFTVSREGLTEALRQSMAAEVRNLVMDAAAAGGTLSELMGAGEVDPGGGAGSSFLTRGAVLTTHGLSSGSGPIQRGVLLRERLLCEPLPPPPSDLDTSPPESDPELNTRDRYAQHSENPACASCHTLIDPLGFAFEHYDHLGQWREADNGHPIDASGSLDSVAFDGPQGLTDVLVADERFQACFDQTWRRWATGSEACGEDRGAVGLIEPLLAVADRESFRLRSGGSEEGDTLAVGPRLSLENLPEDDQDYSGNVVFEIGDYNSWETGFCADATVNNEGAETVTWEVSATLPGEITSIWNAETWLDGELSIFVGVEWNATLAPGETASFGFCGAY